PVMLISFRKHAPNLHRPFKLPYASAIAPIGFVAGALIMYWSGISTLTMVFYTVLLGINGINVKTTPIFVPTIMKPVIPIGKPFMLISLGKSGIIAE
ncbi:MAG: hypothetical protein QXF82_02495, partial [Nitrososphaeria archaeon]